MTQHQPFTIDVLVYNVGQTAALNVSVAAFFGPLQVGRVDGRTIGTFLNVSLNVSGLPLTGTQQILLKVHPDNRINEGGAAQESTTTATVTLNVLPPQGYVAMMSPSAGQTLEPGASLGVTGYVRDQSTNNGIAGVALTIELRQGAAVMASNTPVPQADGFFIGTLAVPSGLADGSYDAVVTPSSGIIGPGTQPITVKKTLPFLSSPVPILGVPWWLFLVILGAAVAVSAGVTVYWKGYGLGKMVECGECGAFIPEGATTRPKCGVQFQAGKAKGSNCPARIPAHVKKGPGAGRPPGRSRAPGGDPFGFASRAGGRAGHCRRSSGDGRDPPPGHPQSNHAPTAYPKQDCQEGGRRRRGRIAVRDGRRRRCEGRRVVNS